MSAKLRILGAAKTVTGSKYLVSVDNFNILIDCGLYQGPDRSRVKEREPLAFPAANINAVILTHAHLDHTGFIPRLVMDGFKGPILCTSATRDFTRIILMDSARIQLTEVAEAKKKNLSKHQVGEPLYHDHDVKFAMGFFKPLEVRDELSLGPFQIIFYQAGHIPGAVSVGLKWEGGGILFSGDLGRYDDYMTFDPLVEDGYKNVVMETTYGGKSHSEVSQFDSLKEVLEKRKSKQGTLLIPSFSLSRTQSILLQLKEVFNSYPELKVPVYVNSPMATEVTEVLIKHNDTIKQDINELKDSLSGFHFVVEPWEVKALYENEGPKVILSASGMLTGGRVLRHLELLGEDPENIIFIPGYQAEGTLGREIIEGEKVIPFEGGSIELKSEVIHSKSFSAHADRDELLSWLGNLAEKPSRVFLTHGEEGSTLAFKETLLKKWPDINIEVPNLNEEFEI